ncbi:amino acid ABC transporter permease [Afipia clevelandensis]|uniref:His/Glu/Gln/Arg/opine family amino ABC transporter, permease, 3-TM region n=1 Tax=Afipia clevelandensis ATCC 49720 TaxID=883079 RepID=K8PNP8_9BRAD|nr:amino acid ABC transporter permease [Afipia clevelandensis]EKS39993.1 His/Glu/Gln/Arg/opine family amino ABC transporter, permease, 3-TM region [Afipia clevelandensis ATCC 49720]
MTEQAAFVRTDMVEQRRAPVRTTGIVGFARERLFNSPLNIMITLIGAALLWLILVPVVKFLFVDAVWQGSDRNACLEANVGRVVGACWPFVQAKFDQFIYGFYPEDQRWRVNLTFALGALLLLPLLIPRAPAKTLNSGLFFFAYPVVGFFLLRGGGLKGFAIHWLADLGSGFAASIVDAGTRLANAGTNMNRGLFSQPAAWIGEALAWIGRALGWLVWPLEWLRDYTEKFHSPLWADLVLTAIIVSLIAFFITGGFRNGWRALFTSIATFAGIAAVIAIMGLDGGGLPIVDTRSWGGLLVTLVVSVTGIVASMPVGMVLALGRRSTIPLIRLFSIAFIEFWRGVPLITVLFFATYMLPLFLPGNFTVDGLVRVLIGIALFAGAYNAEVIRGGLQAVPRGQAEAASALGLSYWKTTGLIVMPQALRNVIPALVNSFIALFKDTTLVLIVAIFDLLGQLRASFADPNWATPTTLFTGFAFTGIIYFVFCFGMSRYSLFVERRLNVHKNV